jgi:hypothetical protein
MDVIIVIFAHKMILFGSKTDAEVTFVLGFELGPTVLGN